MWFTGRCSSSPGGFPLISGALIVLVYTSYCSSADAANHTYRNFEQFEGGHVQCQIPDLRFPLSVWFKGRKSTDFIEIANFQKKNLSRKNINFDNNETMYINNLHLADGGNYRVLVHDPEKILVELDVDVKARPSLEKSTSSYPWTSTDPSSAFTSTDFDGHHGEVNGHHHFGLIAIAVLFVSFLVAALSFCIRRKCKSRPPQNEGTPQPLLQNRDGSRGVPLPESQAESERTSLVTKTLSEVITC
uniref:Uncharacterized protein LOC117354952 n=1 Tax=Geotrypetes seraphini TaxID=260995 RepID=A0A6P8QMV1_GEOSA|nr:uncharacterized protein LOC117354952 [Geotrypetes seraphini]